MRRVLGLVIGLLGALASCQDDDDRLDDPTSGSSGEGGGGSGSGMGATNASGATSVAGTAALGGDGTGTSGAPTGTAGTTDSNDGGSAGASDPGFGGASSGTGGEGTEYLGSCGCPDGLVLNNGYASGDKLPSCDPPSGECREPGLRCDRPNALAACGATECEIQFCRSGWEDCDENPDNGCEKSLSSPETCGSCDNACAPGKLCKAGECVDECAAPRTLCPGDRCVNVASDERDCGGCDSECPGVCLQGACQLPCAEGLTYCAGVPGGCIQGPCPNGLQNECDLCPPLLGTNRICHHGDPDNNCCQGPYGYHYGAFGGRCVYEGPFETCESDCGASELAWLDGLGAPNALTVSGDTVFWADELTQEISAAHETQPTPWTVASDQAQPVRLVERDGKVYWIDTIGMAVLRADTAGGSEPQLLATATTPLRGLAVDATFVYFAERIRVSRVPRDGGQVEDVWTAPTYWNAFDVSLAGSRVQALVANGSGRMSLDLYDSSNLAFEKSLEISGYSQRRTRLARLSVLDGVTSIITWDTAQYNGVAVTEVTPAQTVQLLSLDPTSSWNQKSNAAARGADYTYWGFQGALMRTPNCAGAPRKLAEVPGEIRDIALSQSYVYFAVEDWIGRLPLEP